MLETLNNIDTSVFLFLNHLNLPFLDPFMLAISYNKVLMGVIIIGICLLGFKYFKKQFFMAFFFCLIAFGLSDSISTRIFKDNTKRLRPCHNPKLKDKVYLAGQKCWGGKYGFVSSHASNTFAISMFFWLLFRKRNKYIIGLFAYRLNKIRKIKFLLL